MDCGFLCELFGLLFFHIAESFHTTGQIRSENTSYHTKTSLQSFVRLLCPPRRLRAQLLYLAHIFYKSRAFEHLLKLSQSNSTPWQLRGRQIKVLQARQILKGSHKETVVISGLSRFPSKSIMDNHRALLFRQVLNLPLPQSFHLIL